MVKFISVLLLIGKCWPLLTEMWNFTKLIFASYSRRCQSQWRQSRIEWVKWKCRDSYLVRVEHVVHLFKGIHDMFERLVHETTGYNGAVFDYFLRDLTYFQKGEKQVLVSHDPLLTIKNHTDLSWSLVSELAKNTVDYSGIGMPSNPNFTPDPMAVNILAKAFEPGKVQLAWPNPHPGY